MSCKHTHQNFVRHWYLKKTFRRNLRSYFFRQCKRLKSAELSANLAFTGTGGIYYCLISMPGCRATASFLAESLIMVDAHTLHLCIIFSTQKGHEWHANVSWKILRGFWQRRQDCEAKVVRGFIMRKARNLRRPFQSLTCIRFAAMRASLLPKTNRRMLSLRSHKFMTYMRTVLL